VRPIAKQFVLAILVLLILLLALGALPSLLKSGDPYYLTAEPTDRTLTGENETALDVATLSERSYPYTMEALESGRTGAGNDSARRESDERSPSIGRSSPYWQGPIGVKEAFSHSPFDEIDSLRTRYSATMLDDRTALVRWQNQTYRLAVSSGDT